jgi:hypothetical protein
MINLAAQAVFYFVSFPLPYANLRKMSYFFSNQEEICKLIEWSGGKLPTQIPQRYFPPCEGNTQFFLIHSSMQ